MAIALPKVMRDEVARDISGERMHCCGVVVFSARVKSILMVLQGAIQPAPTLNQASVINHAVQVDNNAVIIAITADYIHSLSPVPTEHSYVPLSVRSLVCIDCRRYQLHLITLARATLISISVIKISHRYN